MLPPLVEEKTCQVRRFSRNNPRVLFRRIHENLSLEKGAVWSETGQSCLECETGHRAETDKFGNDLITILATILHDDDVDDLLLSTNHPG